MKQVNKYNTVEAEHIKDFKNRIILFNETGASNNQVNNAVLTLDNIEDFYTKKNDFFNRLKDPKFKEYKEDYKHTLFYKWIQNYLSLHKGIKEVNYIYSKVTLLDLIEVTCIYVEESKNEN